MAKSPPNNKARASAEQQRKSRDRQKSKAKFKGHGVAYNLPSAQEMYAPARDFAHNYPVMMRSIIAAFNSDYWPELFAWLVKQYRLACPDVPLDRSVDTDKPVKVVDQEEENLSQRAFDDLEQAKDVYCDFLSHCCDSPDETVEDVLKKVGWNNVSTNVQMAWFAMMGQVMTGQLFAGIRDLTVSGGKGGKIEEVMHFIDEGHKARRVFNGLGETEETRNKLREMVRACRKIGMEFDQIKGLVSDVEFGRV